MRFEPNQGQTDPQVKFLARGAGYGVFLTPSQAVLTLGAHAREFAKQSQCVSSLWERILDLRLAETICFRGKSNYFIGNNPAKWHRNVPQFARVRYQSRISGRRFGVLRQPGSA